MVNIAALAMCKFDYDCFGKDNTLNISALRHSIHMAIGVSTPLWAVTTCREPQGRTIGSEQVFRHQHGTLYSKTRRQLQGRRGITSLRRAEK
jgi:hypothetical protein